MEYKIGDILKNARLERGISLDQIEEDTRIRRRYLEAIEDEQWDIVPGRVYLKGFIKTYCRYLGLNDHDILLAFDEQIKPVSEKQTIPQKIELPDRPRRKIGIILGILAILILVASQQVYNAFFTQPETEHISQHEQQQGQEENPSSNEETPSNEELQPVQNEDLTISLHIKAISDRCWIEVKEGKNLLYEGTLTKGQEQDFQNLQEVSFTLGNAGAVIVFLNGEDITGDVNIGQVVARSFFIENNQIIEKK